MNKSSDAEFQESAAQALQRDPSKGASVNSENSVVDFAADTLTGDIRDAILDWRKQMGKPWAACNEDEQSDEIHRARDLAETLVRKACQIIAANGKKAVTGSLIKVAIKDKISVQVDFSKTDEQRHQLIDSQGHLVSLVFADAEPFKGERAPAEAQPDQSSLLDNAQKLKDKKDKVTALRRRKDTDGDDDDEPQSEE